MNKFTILLILIASLTTACQKNQTRVIARDKPPIFYLTEYSNDPEYGTTAQKPIKIGGWRETGGHAGQRWFFRQLTGLNGEPLLIERVGVCCGYANSEAYMGQALIDEYKVYIGKPKKPITLYLDSFEYVPPKIPVGFNSNVKQNKSH